MTPGDSTSSHFKVGRWTVDVPAGSVADGQRTERLEPKVMEVLVCLARRAGTVVSKAELLDAVWPDAHVAEAALSRCISELRRALDDDARSPIYIETLPKRGYRLIAALSDAPHPPAADAPARRRPSWQYAVATLLLLALFGSWWSGRGAARGAIRTIAVVPLRALPEAPDQRLMADGLGEQLIARLSRSGRISVTSGAVAREASRNGAAPREVARSLGVDAVLSGSVQRSAGRVVVSLELASADEIALVWAGSYQESGDDWLEMGTEVAEQAVREIAAALAARDPDRQVAVAESSAVLAHVSRAFDRLADDTPVATLQALQELDDALALGTASPAAWAAVAEVKATQAWNNWSPPVETYRDARVAAQRALDFDPTYAAAHAVLAAIAAELHQDWPEAERRFQTALRSDPDSSYARERFGRFLRRMGRYREALEQSRQAIGIGNADPRLLTSHAWNLVLARRTDEARAAFQQALEQRPASPQAFAGLCTLAILEGRANEGLGACRRAAAAPGHGRQQGIVGVALAHSSRRDEARVMLETLADHAPADVIAVERAALLLALGDHAAAVAALANAAETRSIWLSAVLENALLRPLHGDPRFRAVLETLLIPDPADAN